MPRRVWLVILAVLAGINLWAAFRRHEGTFSHEVVRQTFRTDTKWGRVALVIAWTGLTLWVLPHWLRWPKDRR